MNLKRFTEKILTPGPTFKERIIKGGVWVFSLRLVQQTFGLTRTIVLARLLSPEDFGLFGIALVTLSALDTFSQTGFKQALIQKKGDIEPYLDTAWSLGIIRGLLIAAILFFAAPYAALFFKAPPAELILKVIGISLILQSLTNITVIYFEKELEFHKFFYYQFIGTIVDVIVAISAAILFRSVWALILGLLAGNLTRCIISYLIDPYRPRFYLNVLKAKELFKFGKWILGSSVLVFLLTQGDDLFVGKLLGATALGFYQVAYKLSNLPATEISQVISQVSLPAYSKIQDNVPKLRAAYLKILQITAFLSFPVAGLIYTLAPDFTKLFLGAKWMPIVPTMRVLACRGIIRSLVGTISPLFISIGKPSIVTKLQAIQTILLYILIYPLTLHWHITGTSLAVLFSAITMVFIRNHILIKLLACKIWEFYKLILIPLVLTTLTVFITLFLQLFIISSITIYSFLLCTLIFTLIFIFLITLLIGFSNYKIKLIQRHFK